VWQRLTDVGEGAGGHALPALVRADRVGVRPDRKPGALVAEQERLDTGMAAAAGGPIAPRYSNALTCTGTRLAA